jgi:two-component system cell cycle sensor histidine kinase/response regulator CckA
VTSIFAGRLQDDLERNTGLVLLVIDNTEQKMLETQLAQSQKMQAVGQLAGGIAHDFNNVLTAMIGFCDLLLQRHRPGDQSFADIMQIKQNANRAAALVRQLLAFSRQQTLQPRLLNVTEVLAELSNLLRRLLGEKTELVVAHGRDLGLVKGDQGQMEQVIINLAVNARDAMEGGGTLSIETKNIDTTQARQAHGEVMPAGEYVQISVRDTGMGIPKKNFARIFEPFFTTKEVGSGTGLGLSTVYGIIKQTGGYLFVDSPGKGEGTTFDIFFARQHAAASSASDGVHAEVAEDLTGGGTVLLVEDEDPVRLFSARALRNKGYKVIEAKTGEAALELLDGGPYDLLVTDMMMPRVDGAQVIREARKLLPDLPVICISGYTADSVLKEVESLDSLRFLSKPFSLKQLAAAVKEAIEKNKQEVDAEGD